MNQPSMNGAATGDPPPLPPWWECELFCIHSYAGDAGSPCGWRGKSAAARLDRDGRRRVCPRCGRPTLLPIPLQPETF